MSDQMSNDELIAALRKDAAGSGAEHLAAQAEIDRLEAAAREAATPDAEIRAGLHGLAGLSRLAKRLRPLAPAGASRKHQITYGGAPHSRSENVGAYSLRHTSLERSIFTRHACRDRRPEPPLLISCCHHRATW